MPSSQMGRSRVALIGLSATVIVTTVLKLRLAAHTFGTGDVRSWMRFSAGVAEAGPIGVYRLHFKALYNHPPLIGYMLELINFATRHGLAFPLAIRIPAIAADVFTPFIIFALVRRRRSLHESFAAAVLVAVSPVLFIISGFHGNTDPVFVMFSLLSVYLLVDRRAPVLAGLSIAIAMSVKLVPVVMVPSLVVFAALVGWRFVVRFGIAAGALMGLTWTPVIVRVWRPFREDVLGYSGGEWRWGLVELGRLIGNREWLPWFEGPGRFVAVLVAAGIPATFVLWRPGRAAEAAALALAGLLVLSPAGATQYLAWAAAPAYLLSFWGATAYNLAASWLLIQVYTYWSDGFPWYNATAAKFTHGESIGAFGVWATLLAVVIAGIRRCVSSLQPSIADPKGRSSRR